MTGFGIICSSGRLLGLNPTRGTDNVKPKPGHNSGFTISRCLNYALPLTVVTYLLIHSKHCSEEQLMNQTLMKQLKTAKR